MTPFECRARSRMLIPLLVAVLGVALGIGGIVLAAERQITGRAA